MAPEGGDGRRSPPGIFGGGVGGSVVGSGDGRRCSGGSGRGALGSDRFLRASYGLAPAVDCSVAGRQSSSGMAPAAASSSAEAQIQMTMCGSPSGDGCLPPSAVSVLQVSRMEEDRGCSAGGGDALMVDGELRPGGVAGKQRNVLCFEDGFNAPGAVFSVVNNSSKCLHGLLPSPPASLCMGDANHSSGGCLPPSAQDVCTPSVCCNVSCSASLHDPVSCTGMGSIPQGREGVHQPPECIPGVWGNTPGKSSAAQSLFEGSLDSKLHGGVPKPAWQRPQVFALPILEESCSFSIDDISIRLDDGALADNLKRFEAALVGRLFGKRIPFVHLQSELKRRWEGYGAFRLVMVSLNSFVCFFDNGAARDGVLAGGPWLLAGQVIGLDRWSPTFSPSSMDGYSTPVWVRLPGLPLCCWDKVNIARITSPLGLPLWIDAATNLLERGIFARACVKVDLSKPLKPGIWVHNALGSFYQPVEYEGLPMTCFRCGLVGHKGAACSSATPSVGTQGALNSRRDAVCSPVPVPKGKVAAPGNNSLDEVEPQAAQGLGPWMLVQRRHSSRHAQPIVNSKHNSGASFKHKQQSAMPAKWAIREDHAAGYSSLAGSSLGPPRSTKRSGAIPSHVAKDRTPCPLLSRGCNSKQQPGASATSMAGSPQINTPLSTSLPSPLPPVQEGTISPTLDGEGSLLKGVDQEAMQWNSNTLDMIQAEKSFQVQEHVSLNVQQDDSEQLVFGGFSALPSCSEGRTAASGAATMGVSQRRKAQAGGVDQVALMRDSHSFDRDHMKIVQVQDDACLAEPQIDLIAASSMVQPCAEMLEETCMAGGVLQQEVDQPPVFGGFKAVAECRSDRAARRGAVRRGASHRKGQQSSPLHSSGSQDLGVGPCALPDLSLALVVHPASLGTIVPYCQRLYEDVLPPHEYEEAETLLIQGSLVPAEGCLEDGQRSLKVERMLKDLGPISSLPRKRRLIALDPTGGDVSPSGPP